MESGVLVKSPHSLLPCLRRCLSSGRNPLLLAVPALQRAELGPPGGLLPRGLLHDVGHTPCPVPAGRPTPLPGAARAVRRSPPPWVSPRGPSLP